jgi:hypothetical protein
LFRIFGSGINKRDVVWLKMASQFLDFFHFKIMNIKNSLTTKVWHVTQIWHKRIENKNLMIWIIFTSRIKTEWKESVFLTTKNFYTWFLDTFWGLNVINYIWINTSWTALHFGTKKLKIGTILWIKPRFSDGFSKFRELLTNFWQNSRKFLQN